MKRTFIWLGLAVVLGVALESSAADKQWNTSTDGAQWNTASSWADNAALANGDSIVTPLLFGRAIVDKNYSIQNFTFTGSTANWEIRSLAGAGRTVTVTGDMLVSAASGNHTLLFTRDLNNLNWTVNGGLTINSGTVTFGQNNATMGALRIDGLTVLNNTATNQTVTLSVGRLSGAANFYGGIFMDSNEGNNVVFNISRSNDGTRQTVNTAFLDGGDSRTIIQDNNLGPTQATSGSSLLNINGDTGATYTFAGIIRDAFAPTTTNTAIVALTKSGSNTQILSGVNTYSGLTTVSGGALIINGDQSAATGAVTVDAGATLGGTGIIGGATTISGNHNPGNSPGIQTFNSNLTYNAGALITWELTADTATQGDPVVFDQILVNENLEFAGAVSQKLVFNSAGSTVSWNDAFWQADRQWKIFDVADGKSLTGFANLTLTSENWLDADGNSFDTVLSGANFALSQSGNDITLNYSAIPEPAMISLLGVAGLAALLRRRMRD